MNEYSVVLPIEVMPRNVSYAKDMDLPLHCTVMPWFTLPKESLVPLKNKLMLLASGVEEGRIELRLAERQLFGTQVVRLMHKNETLQLLHTELLIFLCGCNALPKDIQWIGAGYEPHVAPHEDKKIMSGTLYLPNRLVLVERTADDKQTVIYSDRFGQIPF
jgi:hypothetical protein